MRLKISSPAAFVTAAAIAAVLSVSRAEAADPSGQAIYEQRCASCHEQTGARIPTREALQ